MLKQRIITALLLAMIVIGGVLGLPAWGFAILFALVVLLAAWEWGMLLGNGTSFAYAYTAALALLLALVWWQQGNALLLNSLLIIATGFWLWVWVWLYQFNRNPQRFDNNAVLIPVGLILFVPPWFAFIHLREFFGASAVLYLLFLIWIADSGAYFAGRTWGKHKLALNISPGKTWQGVYGALCACFLFALLGAWLFDLALLNGLGFVLLCFIIVAFSIIGDLFESMIKRQRGVKDSSQLLPGHGGVLDRVDSLTAAAPLFLLGLLWLLR